MHILSYSDFFSPLVPFICLASMCYYCAKPEIQISSNKITECPKCIRGEIRYSFIVDGKCPNAKHDLFICEKCFTVYPEDKLTQYFAPFTTFRSKWKYQQLLAEQNNNK